MGCYNDNLLFIHIPKCAGWSVKTYLKEHVPGMLMPDDEESKLPIGHVRLADIEHYTGRSPKSFKRIFAVIRNPYEQQVSQMCFWATRYIQGQRHVHDVATARHLRLPLISQDIVGCALDMGIRFTWQPEHLDVESFVRDPECDFHVWYQQHQAIGPEPAAENENAYSAFGGFYHYWLAIDGEIPRNLALIRQENLDKMLPKFVFDHIAKPYDPRELPPISNLNSSSHRPEIRYYYSPAAIAAVNDKFPWAFKHYYKPWLLNESNESATP